MARTYQLCSLTRGEGEERQAKQYPHSPPIFGLGDTPGRALLQPWFYPGASQAPETTPLPLVRLPWFAQGPSKLGHTIRLPGLEVEELAGGPNNQ